MPIVTETYSEFVARQNCEHFREGHTIRFENGATIKPDKYGRPRLIDAPSGTLANLRARLRYQRWRQSEAEHHFKNLKDALRNRRSRPGQFTARYDWNFELFGDPPPDLDRFGRPCGAAALRHLKAIYDKASVAAAELSAEIARQPEIVAEREREEAERKQSEQERADDTAYLAEIESIEL